jgi:hypothetical protein
MDFDTLLEFDFIEEILTSTVGKYMNKNASLFMGAINLIINFYFLINFILTYLRGEMVVEYSIYSRLLNQSISLLFVIKDLYNAFCKIYKNEKKIDKKIIWN